MTQKLNILFLSNMMEEKGVWTLIEACRLLYSETTNFICHFVGRWSDISEEDFVKRVTTYGLTCSTPNHWQKNANIVAHGAKYGAEKEGFWQQTNIFVFPTYYHNECFPLVLLEAMQHGVACISTQEGGIPEIIENGKNGLLVEKQHPEQLAQAIMQFIKSPQLVENYGQAARKRYEEQFTMSAFEHRMKNIFEDLIENH